MGNLKEWFSEEVIFGEVPTNKAIGVVLLVPEI